MTGLRKAVLAAAGIPAGFVLLLGFEVVHAITGTNLAPRRPFELDALVGPTSDGSPLRMAWIGDSVAAGVGASHPDAALPRVVARALDRPVQLSVFAQSGARAADALADQVPALLEVDPPPDIVVVEVGANDVTHLTGAGSFGATYRRILDAVTEVDADHVLALGIPAFGTSPRFLQPLRAIVGWRGRRLDEEIRASAASHDVRYVDIAARTGPAFETDPERFYAEDDFHPSDAGYGLWARAVLEALRGVRVA